MFSFSSIKWTISLQSSKALTINCDIVVIVLVICYFSAQGNRLYGRRDRREPEEDPADKQLPSEESLRGIE